MANRDNPGPGGSGAETTTQELTRRDFVDFLAKAGAVGLGVALAGGSLLTTGATAVKKRKKGRAGQYRYGMVIDTGRCVGCEGCVLACKQENKTPPDVSYNVVLEEAFGKNPNDRPLFTSRPCFHCDNPPCLPVCPVDPPATTKRESDGIVVIDYDRCIGCQLCAKACPYGARQYDSGENYPAYEEGTPYAGIPSPEYDQFRARKDKEPPIGKVRKCTRCLHLQDEEGRYNKAEGRWPACAKTCTGHAIHFGDFNDPQSEVSRLLETRQVVRLKEDLGTEPSVFYIL